MKYYEKACVAERFIPWTPDLEGFARRVVSLDKELYSTLSLFNQVYKWVPATYCWAVTLRWTSISSFFACFMLMKPGKVVWAFCSCTPLTFLPESVIIILHILSQPYWVRIKEMIVKKKTSIHCPNYFISSQTSKVSMAKDYILNCKADQLVKPPGTYPLVCDLVLLYHQAKLARVLLKTEERNSLSL